MWRRWNYDFLNLFVLLTKSRKNKKVFHVETNDEPSNGKLFQIIFPHFYFQLLSPFSINEIKNSIFRLKLKQKRKKVEKCDGGSGEVDKKRYTTTTETGKTFSTISFQYSYCLITVLNPIHNRFYAKGNEGRRLVTPWKFIILIVFEYLRCFWAKVVYTPVRSLKDFSSAIINLSSEREIFKEKWCLVKHKSCLSFFFFLFSSAFWCLRRRKYLNPSVFSLVPLWSKIFAFKNSSNITQFSSEGEKTTINRFFWGSQEGICR